MKRARTTSFGDYATVSQSQGYPSYFSNSGRGSKTYRPLKKTYKKKVTKQDIERAISRRLENKEYVDYASNSTVTMAGSTLPTAPTAVYLLPKLAQGLGQGARIGNEVHVRSGKVKLLMNCLGNANTITGTPFKIRVWLLSSKADNTDVFSSTAHVKFFNVGSGTVGFQSTPLDLLLPVNTTEYTVYMDKIFTLGLGMITSTNVNQNQPDNSSFQASCEFDWAPFFKQALVYDDNVILPTNRNLFMVFQAVRCDGASGTEGTGITEIHWTNTVKYEDG